MSSESLKEEEKNFKRAMTKVTNGLTIGTLNKSKNTIVLNFGCNACSWRDTAMCPHGITGLSQHANRICSTRVMYIKETYAMAGSKIRLIQVEQAVSLKLLVEKMLADYREGNSLDKQFAVLSKTLIGLTDKMRRQDEGIKINAEVDVFHTDFRKVVHAEAKIIEEQNNRTRQAEFTEEVQPSG